MSSTPEIGDLLQLAVAEIAGSARSGQVEMAQAVWETLCSDSQTLLVQAGTGTGKSLAYAVPAVARAVAAGRSVVIATATIALQRQLADRDLPAVTAALAGPLGRPITFEVLKGRSNYICLDRLNRGGGDDEGQALFDAPTSRLGRQAVKLRKWAEATSSGDRDDLETAVDSRVWSALSVSARECPGAATCPFGDDCFVEAARARCRSADIVVTNHSMLAIHIQGDVTLLPDHGAVIVDEAHELVDRITGALTKELSEPAIERALARAKGFLEPDQVDRVRDCAGFLADVLEAAEPGRLRRCEGELLIALTALRDVGHESLGALKARADDEPELATDRTRARALMTGLHDVAADLITLDDTAVAWLEKVDGRTPAIRLAPLSVTDMLAERLFATGPVVLTSATLSIGGSLERTGDVLGTPQGRVCLDVGSPFDYRKQAMLYCATGLPRPGRDGLSDAAVAELGDLIEAAGGRTLALFSSWRGVDRAFEVLVNRFANRPDLPLLRAHRGDAVASLIKEFAETPEATLLGTLSLWQGVDVPGDSCILVVIDRIPFPRPDDPLVAARQQHIDKQGGNGFASVSVPRAALLLAQGAGRLIRSTDDRGVVAVLDSRLASASYSRALTGSLPPFYLTSDPRVVRQSLARLRDQVSA